MSDMYRCGPPQLEFFSKIFLSSGNYITIWTFVADDEYDIRSAPESKYLMKTIVES